MVKTVLVTYLNFDLVLNKSPLNGRQSSSILHNYMTLGKVTVKVKVGFV